MCLFLEEDPPSDREETEAFLNGSCLYCPKRDHCSDREALENNVILRAIKACGLSTPVCFICPYQVTCVKNSLDVLGIV